MFGKQLRFIVYKYMPYRSFYKAKEKISSEETPTGWEKTFASCSSAKGLISRIHKKHRKLQIKSGQCNTN
jgi:hypothetical protein